MTSRQRVLSAVDRNGYDRIPIKHEGTPEINHMIMDHFGLKNMEQLLRAVGDDFRYVEPVYCGPELRTFRDGSVEGYWGERYKYAQFEGGKYLEASYLPFAGINSLDEPSMMNSLSVSVQPGIWTSSTAFLEREEPSRCSSI